jgi:hypothetical protein
VFGFAIGGVQARTGSGKWRVCSEVLAFALAIYAIVVMLYSMWLPHELVIYGKQTERHYNGYVLSDVPGGRITILRATNRKIVWLRDDEVKHLAVCQKLPASWWSLIGNTSTLLDEVTEINAPRIHVSLRILHPPPDKFCLP